MAHVHTLHEPIHHGEKMLSRSLRSIDDDDLHLWFSVNHIPQVNDVDIVLWHKKIGLFIIEVKAFALQDIHSFSHQSWTAGSHQPSRSPQTQALEAMWSLRNYIEPKMGNNRLSFSTPTACFPKIKRSEWKNRWSDSKEIAALGDAFIFEDDFTCGPETFRQRLVAIRCKPPIGKSLNEAPRDVLEAFIRAMDVSASPKVTVTDAERLTALEKKISRELKKEFPPFTSSKHIFYGHPGTGKTFRLLQIGLFHAQNGANVLMSCFNKVLASDLRRLIYLLSQRQNLEEYQYSIDEIGKEDSNSRIISVFDLFQLALQVYDDNQNLLTGIKENQNLDDWGRQLVSDIRDCPDLIALKSFDTILIDEAQDLKDWQYDLLRMHGSNKPAMVFAIGKGQELYDYDENGLAWVDDLGLDKRETNLRRNFRNSKVVFQVSYAFSDVAPFSEKINSALKKFASDVEGKPVVEFERISNSMPRVLGLNESVLPESSFPEFDEAIADQYYDIIDSELESLQENAEPIDLLLLVPDGSAVICKQLKIALSKLISEKSVGYIDYTDDSNRRQIAPNEKIRLCTFHSARGLEAARVIVFGIERIKKAGEELNFDFKKLGFIVLSRSTFDCVVIRRSFDREIAPFIEKCLAIIKGSEQEVLF